METRSPTGSGTASPSGRSKRKGNNLLRDYYGLGAGTTAGSPTGASSPTGNGAARNGGGRWNEEQGAFAAGHIVDPVDPDSPGFNADVAFRTLVQRNTLAELVRKESDLLTHIRELDGERQSLVYNHHHELVSASETMRKMKERADSLLPSLGSLQTSLQSISTATDSLRLPAPDQSPATQEDRQAKLIARAGPVIELPQRLRDLIALDRGKAAGLAKAQSLWGSMESVLAAWDEAGVHGAKEIMAECRGVLREAQQQQRPKSTII